MEIAVPQKRGHVTSVRPGGNGRAEPGPRCGICNAAPVRRDPENPHRAETRRLPINWGMGGSIF